MVIVRHWGKGNNSSDDARGGYLCWDWSGKFNEVIQRELKGSKCWKARERSISEVSSRVVHYFVELQNICNEKKVFFDDAWGGERAFHLVDLLEQTEGWVEREGLVERGKPPEPMWPGQISKPLIRPLPARLPPEADPEHHYWRDRYYRLYRLWN